MVTGPIRTASQDFRRARRKADIQEVLARLSGNPTALLSFEDVRQKLKAEKAGSRILKEIPLDAIVGSVGRYKDFTRSFLPRRESDLERWARVKETIKTIGLSPIDVYQIDEVYFVLDGHHRVSIAKEIGATHIQANVIRVHTKVPLNPEDQPDDLIIKAEYREFLEFSKLDESRPQADFLVTAPGQYAHLIEQIECHRLLVAETSPSGNSITQKQASVDWYDEIYKPVVRIVRRRGILRDFPGRTETDLYLWVSEHRERLQEELGWAVGTETATTDLVSKYSPKTKHVVTRVGEKLIDAILPDEIEAGPRIGKWRQERVRLREKNQLFADIMVAITGRESDWRAIDQGLIIAKHECSVIHGVHVVSSEGQLDQQKIASYRELFAQKCTLSGITGDFAVDVGKVPRILSTRARWTDLVVISLNYPPAPRPISRLSSGLSTLIRRCPQPILAVPGPATDLERPLLAYDGSPKAEEALYIGAHISSMWKKQLAVVNIQEQGKTPPYILAHANQYINDQGGRAILLERHGQVASQILETAREYEYDIIIMGGYGFNPLVEIALGSAVDEVLRRSHIPVLICR
jgi:nucleotide-binding universal stress UspA family protein